MGEGDYEGLTTPAVLKLKSEELPYSLLQGG